MLLMEPSGLQHPDYNRKSDTSYARDQECITLRCARRMQRMIYGKGTTRGAGYVFSYWNYFSGGKRIDGCGTEKL